MCENFYLFGLNEEPFPFGSFHVFAQLENILRDITSPALLKTKTTTNVLDELLLPQHYFLI